MENGSSYQPTVFNSLEWKELIKTENQKGPEIVLEEILQKKIWSNAEIMWVLKRMLFFYGKKDSLLQKVPVERLFANMSAVLRVLYIVIDQQNPDLDNNLKSYMCAKLKDATWGINQTTRSYLEKI